MIQGGCQRSQERNGRIRQIDSQTILAIDHINSNGDNR